MGITFSGKILPSGTVKAGRSQIGETVYTFEYTGAVETFTTAGTYQVYAWGGGGGSAQRYSIEGQGAGGSGGFVEGILTLQQGDTWYIYVGGPGTAGTSASPGTGGWGGGLGANGTNRSGLGHPHSAGAGGSTEIQLNSTDASDENRLLVAGGGGGASGGYGGNGGGQNGNSWGAAAGGLGGRSSTRNGTATSGTVVSGNYSPGGAGAGGYRGGTGGRGNRNQGSGGGSGSSKAPQGGTASDSQFTNESNGTYYIFIPYGTELEYYQENTAVGGRGVSYGKGVSWEDGQDGNPGLLVLVKI